jgi:Sortilin, neurotensin receptor 3,
MTHYIGMSTCQLTKADLGNRQRGYRMDRLPLLSHILLIIDMRATFFFVNIGIFADSAIAQAFILSESTVHYRTEDRGRTWRPFNIPARPALVAQPLSFHSDPKKYGYILYQGTSCEGSGWRAKCRDHVIDIHF